MRWRGVQSHVLQDTTTRERDVEGAIRAGKTTVCLWSEFNAVMEHPGIYTLLARWTDGGVYGLVLPLWRRICLDMGVSLKWHPDEEFDELPNGSRVYVRGLKSQDQTMRYGKFRGLTLSRVYVDQAEELPEDVYLELAGRLSQKGYPHQITISPQAVDENHWISKQFPANQDLAPARHYYSLSVYDNAHHLDPSVIPALERLYPVGHPKRRTLLEGKRGMNVIGEPVYKGAFQREIHEVPLTFDPRLPLEMALDFGKHHPCVVFRQRSPVGTRKYLGGILGQNLYLDDFLERVLEYRGQWFPGVSEHLECCDPAGTTDTSHGTHGAIKTLREKGIRARWNDASNSPAVRLGVIERMAGQMRKRALDRSEMFQVNRDPERWLRISEQATVSDRFLADGFEAGYVWDEHLVSVSSKPMRKPKKDGWFEHGQNCAEYLEINFGGEVRTEKPRLVHRMPPLPTGPMGWAG